MYFTLEIVLCKIYTYTYMVLNSTVYIYLYIAYSLTYINGQYKNDVDNKTFANQQIGVSWFLQLRLLLRTAIILCMKFQSKSYIHIYKVYIISCIKSRYIYVCNKFKFCFILFDFSSNNTQISVSTASEIFCNFNGFFAEVREKSESSKTARRENTMRVGGAV